MWSGFEGKPKGSLSSVFFLGGGVGEGFPYFKTHHAPKSQLALDVLEVTRPGQVGCGGRYGPPSEKRLYDSWLMLPPLQKILTFFGLNGKPLDFPKSYSLKIQPNSQGIWDQHSLRLTWELPGSKGLGASTLGG